MPNARYVRKFSVAEQKALRQLFRGTHDVDVRTRYQTSWLSSRTHAVSEIAELTVFNEDSVLSWLDRYERQGLSSLEDRPRSGRLSKSDGST